MRKIIIPLAVSVVAANALVYSDIKFEGLVRISPTVASEMAGWEVGKDFSNETLNKAIVEFYKQGYFTDVWATEENKVLTFHFKEKPAIARVDFVGYGESEKEKFKDVVKIKKGDIYDEAKVEAAKQRIIAKVQSDGYFDTFVEAQTKPVGENAVELLLTINKGEKIIITQMTTDGAKSFKQDDILSKAANKANEFMGWLWGRNDGKLKLAELELDPHRVKDFYMQKGYLDAKVSDPLLRVNFDTYQASVDYKIEEGASYKVVKSSIEFGDLAGEHKEAINDLKLVAGKPFDVEKLRKDMENVKTYVADMGYAFAKVYPDLKKNIEKGEVEVVYKVDKGDKVRINNVIIAGNSRTIDNAIRRDIFLAPGDTYRLSDVKDSKNALKRTGYFEDVMIEEKRVSSDAVDLIVTVKEALTGNVMVGGGYGSYDGLLLNAAIQDRNVFGSGLTLGLNVDRSKMRQNYNLSLSNPRYNDSLYSLGGNLFKSKYVSYSYTEDRIGASVSTGKRFTRTTYGGLSYQYVQRQYSDLKFTDTNGNALVTYPEYYKDTTKSSVTASVSYDSTDDYYIPRRGITASASVEYAGMGGEENFAKMFNRAGAFYGLEDLTGFDAILRYKARMGYILDNGQVSIGEKFFMGGVSSVRGYQSSSISKRDTSFTDSYGKNPLMGGNQTFSNSLEVSIPLVPEAKMRLALFYDYGMIGQNSFNEMTRSSTGFAVEWYSPMGPIQLIFANALDAQSGDRTAPFEFTIGTRF